MTLIYVSCRHYCEEELAATRDILEQTKEEIVDVAPKTPTGNKSLSWPIGNEY